MAETGRLRVASTVVLYHAHHDLVAYNYATNTLAGVTPLTQAVMATCRSPVSVESVTDCSSPCDRCAVSAEVQRLLDACVLVQEGTDAYSKDEHYAREWTWGLVPGLFHFGIKDTEYSDPGDATAWLVEHANHVPPIALCQDNSCYDSVLALGRPAETGLLALMRKRRSYRGFSRLSLPVSHLSRCLFAGLGITAFGKTGVKGHDDIPLKYAPSAGGRNPFEAYVIARNVEGIPPGCYHYCGIDGTLGMVRSSVPLPDLGTLVAGQPWFSGASVLILLVAHYKRTMWKYPHPSAYRTVFYEAGHIAQNILLAAAELNLAAAPTSAIADSKVEQLCEVDRASSAVLYAIGLGVADITPSQADIPAIDFIK